MTVLVVVMMKKESLAKNTIMLYLLSGSNYFFGLITVPYLTRVLGAEQYGVIGFGVSCSAIVQMIIDFGFQLSGVIDVANIALKKYTEIGTMR